MTEPLRMGEDGLYLDGLKSVPDRPSLARFGDVAKLVSDFVSGVFMLRAAWHGGQTDAMNPMAKIEAQATKAGNIVLGRDEGWDAQPWNKETRLGNQLRVLLPDETAHYGDPGKALFMWVAAATLGVAQEVEAGKMTEEGAKAAMSKTIRDVASRILGIGGER